MLRIFLVPILIVAQLAALPAVAQSQKESDEIRSKMTAFKGKNFGCTKTRKALGTIAREHPAYHFVFAGRKAATITGIRGCGYAWNVDLNRARAVAMENCRRWESEYGTGGGKWTCRLMK